MRLRFVLRWTLATALAGAVVGALESTLRPVGASLFLPGLAIGLAQRLAAPKRVPSMWTLFSGLAWVAGAMLDAATGFRPAGLGLWLIPTLTMALWQTFLLNDLRRAWPWPLVSLVAAGALQAAAERTCQLACGPLSDGIGPAAATAGAYGGGFAAFGLLTGLGVLWLGRDPDALRPASPTRDLSSSDPSNGDPSIDEPPIDPPLHGDHRTPDAP
ncbi:MAG: hypothetical protein WD336_05380 [Trueperaceae bacterium]